MDGVTKALKPSIGKDELFVLEDSRPQVKLTASTGLKVSIKGGIEVSANQKETTDTEIYQLESAPGGKWALKCNTSLYWGVDDSGAVKAESKDKNESSLFTVKWLDNKIALVASNGKVVTVKGNKQLQATQDLSADIPEESLFVYELINRPRLVLRGHWGFVGEMEKSKKLECNKSTYETLSMHIKSGVCEIKASSGYLKISDDRSEVTATGASPTGLFMEIVDDTTMALKYKDASGDVHYMQGDQNGGTNFLGSGLTEFTLWEF
jgi:fascin 1/2